MCAWPEWNFVSLWAQGFDLPPLPGKRPAERGVGEGYGAARRAEQKGWGWGGGRGGATYKIVDLSGKAERGVRGGLWSSEEGGAEGGGVVAGGWMPHTNPIAIPFNKKLCEENSFDSSRLALAATTTVGSRCTRRRDEINRKARSKRKPSAL